MPDENHIQWGLTQAVWDKARGAPNELNPRHYWREGLQWMMRMQLAQHVSLLMSCHPARSPKSNAMFYFNVLGLCDPAETTYSSASRTFSKCSLGVKTWVSKYECLWEKITPGNFHVKSTWRTRLMTALRRVRQCEVSCPCYYFLLSFSKPRWFGKISGGHSAW